LLPALVFISTAAASLSFWQQSYLQFSKVSLQHYAQFKTPFTLHNIRLHDYYIPERALPEFQTPVHSLASDSWSHKSQAQSHEQVENACQGDCPTDWHGCPPSMHLNIHT